MLKGDKVFLKLIERSGLPERVKWINDPEIQKTLLYDYPTSQARTEKWFDKIALDLTRRDFEIYTHKTSMSLGPEYIGFCGLMNIEVPVMKAELYAVIGDKKCWSGGFGTEVYKLLVNYGFEELGLNKIYGYQLENNIGAHRVVEKLGWVREGLLRDEIYAHGKLHNLFTVSITRKDWENHETYKAKI